MEEKIIEASFTKNKFARNVLLVGIGLTVLGFILAYINYQDYLKYTLYPDLNTFIAFLLNRGRYFLAYYYSETFAYVIWLGVLVIISPLFFIWQMSGCSLTVTNKRVTGKASFRKTVDLPLNQISAVSLGSSNRITVATSSGSIHFWFVENRAEVYPALLDIISKVQIDAKQDTPTASNADELKKYKDLLDGGVITQEEFDAKKKQLLGL